MKTESGIKNGLPWTKDDDEQFVDLPKETQETVKFWITTNLLANNEKGKPYSSYYLKHCLEHATGVYLTNNQYKGAMLSCELFPENDSFLNWEYMLDKKSKGIDINTQESIGNFNDDFTQSEDNDSEIKQEVNLFF